MIHQTLLNARQRIDYPAKLFGHQFPFVLEPNIFHMAAMLSADYKGGFWQFYALSHGGFYMAPEETETAQTTETSKTFRLSAPNGYEGTLSANAMGITACLYAYSHLSMSHRYSSDFAQVCAVQYHLLREFAMGHAEEAAIWRAID